MRPQGNVVVVVVKVQLQITIRKALSQDRQMGTKLNQKCAVPVWIVWWR
jgi:hypothetical protein